MKKYNINASGGFTLAEVLVSLVFIVAIMGGIATLFSTSVIAWQRGTSRNEIQQAARFAVDSIARDIKYASAIIVTNINNVSTITLTTTRDVPTGQPPVTIIYTRDANTGRVTRERIDSVGNSGGAQPVTGETSTGTNNIEVTELQFLELPRGAATIRTVNIFIAVRDNSRTPQTTYELETAATSMVLSQ